MQDVRTVGIISRPGISHGAELVPGLLAWLFERNITVRYDHETATYAGHDDGLPRQDVPEGCEFIIVLGGDGTLLSAAKAIAHRQIPLLGVNLGGLGFLTAISADEIYPALEKALRGEHRIGHRQMLECSHVRGEHRVGSYLALNDVVVSKRAAGRMVDLEVYVDNHHVCSYKADGLIVATPTGSTAYSLSAGGPIVFPQVAALAITPICPHMLTNRPVIVPDTTIIQIVYHSEDEAAYLNVDGQQGVMLLKGDRIFCRASSNVLKLIRPPRLLYFDVLREKLKWGER